MIEPSAPRRRIRLDPAPSIPYPARRAFVLALREVLTSGAFSSLNALGGTLRPRRSKQRLSELAAGKRLPDRDELAAVVTACRPAELSRLQQLLFRAAAEESAVAAGRAQPAFRLASCAVAVDGRLPAVDEFRHWTRLGVHPPITRLSSGQNLSERVRAGELPTYVEREKDAELRPALAAAAAGEGPPVRLVLVTGASLAGKTRAAVEAMQAELPTWRLLIPRSARGLAEMLDAQFNLRHTVLWLDEVQEMLEQDIGSEQLNRLLDLPVGPTVLLATLRADTQDAFRDTAGDRLLRRANTRITLHRRPLPAELERALARAHESDDLWLAEALDKIGDRYGIAEWLAAGPQLADQLEYARASDDPVKQTAAALVDAAIDCYRAGYTQPIPEPLLVAAHQLHLPEHLRHAPRPLTAEAMAWARTSIAGASPLLEHHRNWGDRAFDYLLATASDTALATPQRAAIPKALWQHLIAHVTPSTARQIARAAYRAGQRDIADDLIRRNPHDEPARLYADVGNVEALTELADAGDRTAARSLVELLVDRGDAETLTARAAAGDYFAGQRLADLLARLGDADALAARADTGDDDAAWRLAELLADRGDINTLTTRADGGERHAAYRLAGLLVDRGDAETLTARADAGDNYAALALAELGDLNAPTQPDPQADLTAGNDDTGAWWLVDRIAAVDRLADAGDLDALTTQADAGNPHAAWRLAELLAERGDLDTLTARAAVAGFASNQLARRPGAHHLAARKLVELLTDRGDLDALTARADAGDTHAAARRAELLELRGDLTTLTALAAAGDRHAAEGRAGVLAARGELDALTTLAEAGDDAAAWRLVELLADRGELTTLTARADAGDNYAGRRLVDLLADRGDLDALTARADAGDTHAAARRAELLAERSDLKTLAALAAAGDSFAALELTELRAEQHPRDLEG
ncbi:hypothetical protein K1T35_48545 (plasmid) [Pseudonocardia sp. DSM 110487]|uniref:hypothetical protein n=1 Tax=Pseudonocardia sp. DSM 110487 TaxID=2865833 RepID=UPI001C6A4FD7|nr:hypothetical protein [Pseudonocardia sp. DSM 110487]QYN41198.1 hypothetical protein K1T35_48545 [Pseudonocardia sp. DSM 110487]